MFPCKTRLFKRFAKVNKNYFTLYCSVDCSKFKKKFMWVSLHGFVV